jgi:streptomycin 6-kinase
MQFEILYQELVQSTEVIRALVTGITQAEARFKPDAESWSILEVLGHLHDVEIEDFRLHLDSILHRSGEEWELIDPGSWITERAYNERNLTEALDNFLAEREKSLIWLKSLAAPNWEAEHRDQYGSIKAGEMFVSWVAHDNLHIRQLVELRRARIVTLAEPFDVGYAGDW